jgi:Zn-dependent protease/CBS domain-containing protein
VPEGRLLGDVELWALGAATAILLFASVLVHELAHSFAAKWRGMEAKSITLFIFGGVSNLSGDAKNASTEFLVAIVGPLTSFALAAIAFALATISPEPRSSLVLSYLFFINLTLGIFNLIPGFPLDGGRVLRSILWTVTGNVARATKWAANVGKLVAGLMVGLAAFMWIGMGNPVGAVWTAAIAWFLFNAASMSVQQVVFEQRLAGLTVSQLIPRDETTVSPDLTVSELVDTYILPQARRAIPVADNGQLLGMVTVQDIAGIAPDQRSHVTVRDVMSEREKLQTTTADATVLDAFEVMTEHDLEQLPVLDGDLPVGLITRADVARLLRPTRA